MKWQNGTREDPTSCREKDLGKFEITKRALRLTRSGIDGILPPRKTGSMSIVMGLLFHEGFFRFMALDSLIFMKVPGCSWFGLSNASSTST